MSEKYDSNEPIVDPLSVGLHFDKFESWLAKAIDSRRDFPNLATAFCEWLYDGGFRSVDGNFDRAVAVLIAFVCMNLRDPSWLTDKLRFVTAERTGFLADEELDVFVKSWSFMQQHEFASRYDQWLRDRRLRPRNT